MHIKLNALLVATDATLAFTTAPILKRAGFNIHLIGLNSTEQSANYSIISSAKSKLAISAYEAMAENFYDLIILADDRVIGEILESDLTIEQKLRLLPIVSDKDLKHLFSKCGLSEVLLSAEISTPDFLVCKDFRELCLGAAKLGFPLFIKVDSSGGGAGVFECSTIEEVQEKSKKLPYPLLLQKKINGKILDLTAFYQNRQLIYFSYSIFLKTKGGPFGPSILRKYTQIGNLSEDVFQELEQLGQALGANGFANTTCIECADTGKRFYIEADMRPNIWVDKGRYLGFDISTALSNFFLHGTLLTYPHPTYPCYPVSQLIAHVDRLKLWEILLNRYKSWKSFNSVFELILYLQKKFFRIFIVRFHIITYQADLKTRVFFSNFIKPKVPKKVWKFASNIYRKTFHKNNL